MTYTRLNKGNLQNIIMPIIGNIKRTQVIEINLLQLYIFIARKYLGRL